ncbi:hypothetical protein ZWY2020_018135 [Hordeum vulgare]|nr:hypothetical protein ZWY2020_018135 [Hordeum vulgare]
MTQAPGDPFSSGFPHADAAQSKPIPTYPQRIKKRLLPMKKRATTTSDGSDRSSADDSFVVPPKKRRAVDTGGEGTPAQRRPRRVAACNAAHVSMEEEEAGTSAAGAAGAKKKNKNRKRKRESGRKNGPRPARKAFPLVNRPLHLSEEQQQHLRALGATAPQFVIMKTLHGSDVHRNQSRLLFSCKRKFIQAHPITGLLAEEDAYFVHERFKGLSVSAFDGHNNEFSFDLKYLDSNGGYRFKGSGWNEFVATNNLVQLVKKERLHFVVELWAFRSPMLPAQSDPPDVEGLKGHPDGALGFHFRVYQDESRDAHRGGGEEERELAPSPVQKRTKRQAPAKAVRSKKLAGARVSQGQAVARDVTRAEIVEAVGEEMADALLGLLMLARKRILAHNAQTVSHSHAYADCATPYGSQNFGS